MLSFFPRGVLDEILDLIESVAVFLYLQFTYKAPKIVFKFAHIVDQDIMNCLFCESSCLFYLSFNSDFYISKIMHL